ncbi:MAG: Phospholipase D family protein, partial [bacterium]
MAPHESPRRCCIGFRCSHTKNSPNGSRDLLAAGDGRTSFRTRVAGATVPLMRPGLLLLLGSMGMIGIAMVLSAHAAGSTGTIVGTVRGMDGKALPAASFYVKWTDHPLGGQSNRNGEFRSRDVPVGVQRLVIRKLGWRMLSDLVVVRPNETAGVDYTLEPGAVVANDLPALDRPVDFDSVRRPLPSGLPLLVESYPDGTTLDTDLPDAADAWRHLLAAAGRTIDIVEFYVSDNPAGPSDLSAVIDIIKARAREGVHVRLLVEEKFYKTYPTWVIQLDSLDNVESRRLDYAAIAGGILHAKYFVVDGQLAYLGSQNFDWRALEHIQELGIALSDEESVAGLNTLFEMDWARGVPIDTKAVGRPPRDVTTHERGRGPSRVMVGSDTLSYQLLASPKSDLPAGVAWDLPYLIDMIDSARDSIAVQLLTYKPRSRSGEMWDELDGALRRAAKRGVAVRLLVSNWGKRAGTVEQLQELSQVSGFELRFMNIPEWSGGFIPFARTAHAKYMVVDGRRFWLGTSNWERDYFYNSRNVGIVGVGRALGAELSQFFRNGW